MDIFNESDFKREEPQEFVDSSLSGEIEEKILNMLQKELDDNGSVSIPNLFIPDLLDEDSRDKGYGGYLSRACKDFEIEINGQKMKGKLWVTNEVKYLPQEYKTKEEEQDGYVLHSVDLSSALEKQFNVCDYQNSTQFDLEVMDKILNLDKENSRLLQFLDKCDSMTQLDLSNKEMPIEKENATLGTLKKMVDDHSQDKEI